MTGRFTGGEGEIRTHGTREGSTVFETAAFDHSATSPHARWTDSIIACGCGKTARMSLVSRFIAPYRIENGKKFRLKDIDPADTGSLRSKKAAKELLQKGVSWLAEEQGKLYAQNCWSVLLIFQAMDAAGKDGSIRHVMSGINPQGCQVFSFKAPSAEELDHDFLWRTIKRLPERGRIGIHNRSYYEETLVARVHPQILKAQRIPPHLIGKNIWKERYEDIVSFERYLSRNGTIIRKFFLHVSKEEQKKRFMERLNDPEKNWKFSRADIEERQHWDEYMMAYEQTIRNTATKEAPWYVVPADNKWFTRLVVAGAIIDAMQSLKLSYPKINKEKQAELQESRNRLMEE